MSVDRTLLREPFDDLRSALAAQGITVDVPPQVADQVRAAFRFDLTQVGVDTSDTEIVAGAIGGLACAVKMLSVLGVATNGVCAQFVGLFDVIWPILDEDFDAQVEKLTESWGTPGYPRVADEEPPLPKVPTADKPVVTDMTAWARKLAGGQFVAPPNAYEPQEIEQEQIESVPDEELVPDDDDEVTDAEILDEPFEMPDDEHRPQRRSWWGKRE